MNSPVSFSDGHWRGEYLTPPAPHWSRIGSLPALWEHVRTAHPQKEAFRYLHHGMWHSMSSEEFDRQLQCLTLALEARGIGPGEAVGLIARPSPWWLMMDLATQLLGAVVVPMFPNITPENFDFEVQDAGIRHLYVDSDRHLLPEIRTRLPRFRNVFAESITREGFPVRFVADLLQQGDALRPQKPGHLDALRNNISSEAIATLIYTSGSTGIPKGVALSHRNLLFQLRGATDRFPPEPGRDKGLTGLPLAHVFERIIVYYYLASGIQIHFADDTRRLGELLRTVQPQILTVVPRLLEKVMEKMRSNADEAGGIKGRLIHAAMDRAETDPHAQRRLLHPLFDRLVYSAMREALGGHLRILVSGGAKLPERVGRYFQNIGLPLREGYGLTECSPVVSANFGDFDRLGSVGLPFPGVEVKLGADRELWVRGEGVMLGYHGAPEATRECLDGDGWLHTGDEASIDEQGYIRILGRLKELLKTTNGKYIAPAPIEQALTRHPRIEYAVVFGDGHPHPVALLFLDGALQNGNELQQELADWIMEVNRGLAPWEQLHGWRATSLALSPESGTLTPTLKVRRHAVALACAPLLEALYAEISLTR